MRVVECIEVSATPEGVWEHVSDPSRYLHFLSGFTRWEVASDEPAGLGARYRMLMRVGSAEVGGLVEIVEWDEGRDIAWNSAGPASSSGSPTGSPAPGSSARCPSAWAQGRSEATSAAHSSSSSARSSTKSCARARQRAARRARAARRSTATGARMQRNGV